MTKKEILKMTGLTEEQFYKQYPTKKAWEATYKHGGTVDVYQLMGMPTPSMYGEGGGIHIKPSKKGTFTAAASKHGKSVQAFASQVLANKENYSPAMVKKANFARNASKWKHKEGGPISYIPSYAFGNVQSKNTTYNHGFGYGGIIPMYGKGGFLNDVWTGVKDYGLLIADNAASVVNPDIIKSDAYSDTGFGKKMKNMSNVIGTFTNKVAPTAANLILPGSGMAVSAVQNIGGNFVEGDPERMNSKEAIIAGQLGGLGSMAGSFMNPMQGAAGGGTMATATGGMPMMAAMGGQVNYPQGLRKNMGNMPIFAEGGMTGNLTQINVEKGELLTDKNGKIVTEYRGGGMVPHPEEGMDERGTVPAQEGMFVITKAQAKNYKNSMKNNDKLYADSIRNSIAFDKAKKEAKEQAAEQAQQAKANAAYGRFMKKYGGVIGKYDEGSWTMMNNLGQAASGPRNDYSASYMNLGDTAYGDTPFNLSSILPGSLTAPKTMEYGPGFGANMSYDPAGRQGVDSNGYPVSINPAASADYKVPGMDTGNIYKTPFNPNIKAGDVLPYVPVAWNAVQAMRRPTKVPSFAMDTNLVAPQLTDRQGKREITEMANLGKYNARQIGGSGILPALTNLTTNRMKTVADYRENLDTKNAMLNFDAATKRKAYEQFNADAAMKRYMLQAQADAVPTQYASAAAEGLGKIGDTARQNAMTKYYLDKIYPYLNK